MTVAELIAQLDTLDPSFPVALVDSSGDLCDYVTGVHIRSFVVSPPCVCLSANWSDS